MSIDTLRGRRTKRGHEFCVYPPEDKTGYNEDQNQNILRCDDVQGLEQGLYIVSRAIRGRFLKLNEYRHHLFMQVYQDFYAKQKIEEFAANLHEKEKQIDELYHSQANGASDYMRKHLQKEKEYLNKLKKSSNRALIIEVYGATNDCTGSLVVISSVSNTFNDDINPDLNDPATVISPILTKSDVEKVDGVQWVDPDRFSFDKCLRKIRKTIFFPLGNNCKEAALQLVKAGLDAMPGLTPEMRTMAQENMDKPVNSNASLSQILGNTMQRGLYNAIFKPIMLSADQLPTSNIEYGVTIRNTFARRASMNAYK